MRQTPICLINNYSLGLYQKNFYHFMWLLTLNTYFSLKFDSYMLSKIYIAKLFNYYKHDHGTLDSSILHLNHWVNPSVDMLNTCSIHSISS